MAPYIMPIIHGYMQFELISVKAVSNLPRILIDHT